MALFSHLQRLFARLRRGFAGLAAGLLLGALVSTDVAALEPGVEFHRSGGIVWTVTDIALYNRNKANYDALVRDMSKALAPVRTLLGEFAPNPIHIHAKEGRCVVGVISEAPLGTKGWVPYFGDTCMVTSTGTTENQAWVRHTVLAYLYWEIFPPISAGWPELAFQQPVSRLLQTELVRKAEGDAIADGLLAQDDTEQKRRRVKYYRDMVQAHGWAFLQSLFAKVKADTLNMNRVDANNSIMQTNYLVAYQSLGLKLKMGKKAGDGGLGAVTDASVMQVLRARNLLAIADRKGLATKAAWEAYRTGKPDQVISLLPSP